MKRAIILLLTLLGSQNVSADCLDKAISLAERSCNRAYDASIELDLKFIKVGATTYPNLTDCMEGEKNKAIEIYECKKPNIETFYLFRSDVNRAPQYYRYIGCSDPNDWAKNTCISHPSIELLSTESGGACGHGTYRVICEVH